MHGWIAIDLRLQWDLFLTFTQEFLYLVVVVSIAERREPRRWSLQLQSPLRTILSIFGHNLLPLFWPSADSWESYCTSVL